MTEKTSLAALQSTAVARKEPDQRVDMFSSNGFALACRIANAFASSDAVPAQFRNGQMKKVNGIETWVDNPSGIGNCIVAIETAQSVGMSVTNVMMNADVIEGKLRWSDKFIVGSVNASGRFTPLRFDMENLGMIKAKYREKLGWNQQKRGFDFADREVEVENLQCTAWALPAGMPVPANIQNMKQAKKAGLPVIEGVPVSIKLAVEEGWYAKPGSKWQTDLKFKMLMMRAGRYFGDIHASDIVMGFGRSSDEERDMIDINPVPHAEPAKSLDELRGATPTTVIVDEVQAQQDQHEPAGYAGDAGAEGKAQMAEQDSADQEVDHQVGELSPEEQDYQRSMQSEASPELGQPSRRRAAASRPPISAE